MGDEHRLGYAPRSLVHGRDIGDAVLVLGGVEWGEARYGLGWDEVVRRVTVVGRERVRGVVEGRCMGESERLERVARLTTFAEQVWESDEDAQQFLTTPHPLLDGASPLDLASTELGARRVEDLLLKLEYSLPV